MAIWINSIFFLSEPSKYVKLHLHFYIYRWIWGGKSFGVKMWSSQAKCCLLHDRKHSPMSTDQNWNTFILVKCDWIKEGTYTLSDVFKQLVLDLNNLENEGLDITNQGHKLHVKGWSITLSADNLSTHDIGRFQNTLIMVAYVDNVWWERLFHYTPLKRTVYFIQRQLVHQYYLDAVLQDPSKITIYMVFVEIVLWVLFNH